LLLWARASDWFTFQPSLYFRSIAALLLNLRFPAFGFIQPALLPAVPASCIWPLHLALLLFDLATCYLFGALASAFGLAVPASCITAIGTYSLLLCFLLVSFRHCCLLLCEPE